MEGNEKIQAIAHDLLTAFQTGALPAALAQVFIRRDIDVPSKHWTWTNRTVGILRGHVYAAGFRQWEQLGRHVKKGEHAFYILAPKLKKEEDDSGGDDGSDRMILVGYQPIAVFASGTSRRTARPCPVRRTSRLSSRHCR